MAGAVLAPNVADTFFVPALGLHQPNNSQLPYIKVAPGTVGLVKFDLSTLPVGTKPDEVERAVVIFGLQTARVHGGIDAHVVLNPSRWAESSGVELVIAGDAFTRALCQAEENHEHFITLDVTAAVKEWLRWPDANHGIALVPSALFPHTSVDLESREYEGITPVLDVQLFPGRGYVGTPGPAGERGAVGPVGPMGPLGPRGLKGEIGAAGAAGPAGPAGAVGPAGPAGVQGLKGETGAIGPVGPVGAIGPVGPVGPVGAMGPVGPVGPVGAIGPVGPVGPVGAIGPVGLTGAVGPQGLKGDTGATGLTGPVGAIGPMGQTGPVGPQGLKGDIGATGAAGLTGPAGAIGPQGPKGNTGATGLAGPAGPAGEVGPAGAAGPMGLTGPMGPQGLSGIANLQVVQATFGYGDPETNAVMCNTGGGWFAIGGGVYLRDGSQPKNLHISAPYAISGGKPGGWIGGFGSKANYTLYAICTK